MNKTSVALAFAVFAYAAIGYAQTGNVQKDRTNYRRLRSQSLLRQSKHTAVTRRSPESPAEKRDIDRLREELYRVRRSIDRHEKLSDARSESSQSLARDRANMESRSSSDLKNAIETAALISSRSYQSERRMIFIILGSCAAMLSIIVCLLFIRPPGRQKITLVAASNECPIEPSITNKSAESVVSDVPTQKEVLVDPDISALKHYSEEHGGVTAVPFIIKLREGPEVAARAQLRVGRDPLVWFDSEVTPVRWDCRKQAAAKIALK